MSINKLVIKELPKLWPINSKLGMIISLGESHGSRSAPNYNIVNSNVRVVVNGDTKSSFPARTVTGLTNMTIGQVMQRHKVGHENFWAAGRWQITPQPMREFVSAFGLAPSTKFDTHTQDLYVLYALLYKRKIIRGYIIGSHDNINGAALGLAQEWASKPTRSGQSFYSKNGVDKAHAKYEDVLAALKDARDSFRRFSTMYAGRTVDYIMWLALHDGTKLKLEDIQKSGSNQTAGSNVIKPLNANVTPPRTYARVSSTPVRAATSTTVDGTLIITGSTYGFRTKDGKYLALGALS